MCIAYLAYIIGLYVIGDTNNENEWLNPIKEISLIRSMTISIYNFNYILELV